MDQDEVRSCATSTLCAFEYARSNEPHGVIICRLSDLSALLLLHQDLVSRSED